RQRVVLTLVRKGLLVEGFEDDVDLLLEQLTVGLLVTQGCAERLDLACVIAATDAEHDSAASQDIGGRIVLREPQRMPHRRNVETAANFDLLCTISQMHCQ